MTGADLKCECSVGAADVAPDIEIFGLRTQMEAISWKCTNGHQNITGFREVAPNRIGFEQWRFDENGNRVLP